jgi:hypothetical protein
MHQIAKRLLSTIENRMLNNYLWLFPAWCCIEKDKFMSKHKYTVSQESTMWIGSTLTLLAFLSTLATASSTFIRQSDLLHDKWVSLQRNVEFLPATTEGRIPYLDGRKLQSSSSYSSPYSVQPFVETESEYDEYQQAWRYLGFMIDCNDYTYTGDDDDGGSGDGGTGEGCHRYVLWAAVSS